MCYWSGLYPEDMQNLIKERVDLNLKTAIKLIGGGGKLKKELMDAVANKDVEGGSKDKLQDD
jgi:hypothetical protein